MMSGETEIFRNLNLEELKHDGTGIMPQNADQNLKPNKLKDLKNTEPDISKTRKIDMLKNR